MVGATGGPSSRVCVWDTTTGEELGRLRGKARADLVAFSLDGKVLITAQRSNGAIQHWETGTGRLVHQTGNEEHFHFFTGSFSPDRKLLALTNLADKLGVYDVSTGKLRFMLSKPGCLAAVAFSNDARLLATAGNENFIQLWEAASGKELRQLKGVERGISSLQFAPGDKALASITRKGFEIWELATGKQIQGGAQGGSQIVFSPSGGFIATAQANAILLLDAASGKELRRFEGHRSWWIADLAFSADGKMLASGGRDHTVALWDVASGKRLHSLAGHQGAVISLAFRPDGRELASGGDEDHALLTWDVSSGRRLRQLNAHRMGVLAVAYSPDGKILATGDGWHQSGTGLFKIRLWNNDSGQLLREFDAHRNGVYSLAFAPDGRTLGSGGGDDFARVWEVATGRELQSFPVDSRSDQIGQVAFSRDGKFLGVVSRRGEIVFCDVREGKASVRLPGGYGQFLAFPAEGEAWLSVERRPNGGGVQPGRDPDTEYLRWWDLRTGVQTRALEIEGPFSESWALSNDGKTLAMVGKEDTIRIWDLVRGKQVAALRGHSGAISSLAFSPDGKTLASGSWDTTVLLWNIHAVRLNALWSDLGLLNEKEALAASESLLAMPEDAVPLIKDHLVNLAAVESRVVPLLAALDADDFKVREKATAQLQAMGAAADFPLRRALEGSPSAEARTRMERLLADLQAKAAPPAVPLPPMGKGLPQDLLAKLAEKPQDDKAASEKRRILAAFSILEKTQAPEARQVLTALAQGEANGWVTRKAKECLKR